MREVLADRSEMHLGVCPLLGNRESWPRKQEPSAFQGLLPSHSVPITCTPPLNLLSQGLALQAAQGQVSR